MDVDFGFFPEAYLALVAFDLDDTLAPSKTALPQQMSVALSQLLKQYQVAVISGGDYPQFRTQLVDPLFSYQDDSGKEKNESDSGESSLLSRLHLLPTCGTQYFSFDGKDFISRYCHEIPPERRRQAISIIEKTARKMGLWAEEHWGDIIEDRRTQLTFSALGQQAPLEKKRAWDPTGEKKNALRDALAPLLPELEVRAGGATSVDITRKGIDKGYGMGQLLQITGLKPNQVLFVGDRLDEHGNDYPVVSTGIACKAVGGWQDTVAVIDTILTQSQAARTE